MEHIGSEASGAAGCMIAANATALGAKRRREYEADWDDSLKLAQLHIRIYVQHSLTGKSTART